MTESEELRAILFAMLYQIYPDRTKDILKSLRIIKESVKEICKKYSLNESDEDIMECITKSLCFGSLRSNVEDD